MKTLVRNNTCDIYPQLIKKNDLVVFSSTIFHRHWTLTPPTFTEEKIISYFPHSIYLSEDDK